MYLKQKKTTMSKRKHSTLSSSTSGATAAASFSSTSSSTPYPTTATTAATTTNTTTTTTAKQFVSVYGGDVIDVEVLSTKPAAAVVQHQYHYVQQHPPRPPPPPPSETTKTITTKANPNPPPPPTNKSKKSRTQKFEEAILNPKEISSFKKPFRQLGKDQQDDRVRDVGKVVLAACIDRNQFRKVGAREYLKKNVELASDISDFLDDVKSFVGFKTGVRMDRLKKNTGDGILTLDEAIKRRGIEIGEVIFKEVKYRNGYERVRKVIGSENIPSHYIMKKRQQEAKKEAEKTNETLEADSNAEDPLEAASSSHTGHEISH